MSRIAVLALLLSLFSCSGGGNSCPTPSAVVPTPQAGQWASAYGQWPGIVGASFAIPNCAGVHYVYTPAPSNLASASTITLTYTVSGNATFGINDPSDTPPPQVTMFIWQNGDNLSCQGNYANDRQFSNQRSPVQNGAYTLSVQIDQSAWHNCFGQPVGLSQALGNPAYVGFTLGGANFDGHGVYVQSGSATFTIDSFTVQ